MKYGKEWEENKVVKREGERAMPHNRTTSGSKAKEEVDKTETQQQRQPRQQ